jgi:hypothetical protein
VSVPARDRTAAESGSRVTAGIDQAALPAALLAVSIQFTGEPGPWVPLNSVVGLILEIVVAAYAEPRRGRRWWRLELQPLAVAVIAAVSVALALSWPAQTWIVARYAPTATDDELGDITTAYLFPVVIVIGGALVYWRIVRSLCRAVPPRARKRRRTPALRRGSS